MLSAAGAASDTDTFLTGQGTNVLTRQTLAALWAWMRAHLPGYKVPVLEVTANLTVDATYNGKILVVTSAGVTISPNYALMGAGFECEIVTSGVGHGDLGRRRDRDQRRDRPAGRRLREVHGVHVERGERRPGERRHRLGRRRVAAGHDQRLDARRGHVTTLAFTWTAPSSGGAVDLLPGPVPADRDKHLDGGAGHQRRQRRH